MFLVDSSCDIFFPSSLADMSSSVRLPSLTSRDYKPMNRARYTGQPRTTKIYTKQKRKKDSFVRERREHSRAQRQALYQNIFLIKIAAVVFVCAQGCSQDWCENVDFEALLGLGVSCWRTYPVLPRKKKT